MNDNLVEEEKHQDLKQSEIHYEENEEEDEEEEDLKKKNKQSLYKQKQSFEFANKPFSVQDSFLLDNKNQIRIYKKRITFLVLLLSIVLIFIILERLFYDIILKQENDILSTLQSNLDLQQIINIDNIYLRKFNSNIILDILAYLNVFKYNFLLLTLYISIIFMCVSPEMAIKVGYVSIYMDFVISCIQLIYEGPRPFWQSNDNKEKINNNQQNVFVNTVSSPVCENCYGHPSKQIFMLFFIGFYTLKCIKQKKLEEGESFKYEKLIYIATNIFILLIAFVKFLIGENYLINMALGFAYFLIFYQIIIILDKVISNILQKSTLESKPAKKYSFYWFLVILLSIIISTILYIQQSYFPPAEWLRNYIDCKQQYSTNTKIFKTSYDEIMGPWFTFIQTSILFGLLGFVFAVAYTYRNLGSRNNKWYKGSIKNKIYRSLIILLFMVPSFVITLFQEQIVDAGWFRQIGFNEFYFCSMHYFFLYFVIFAGLPIIFTKLKIVEDAKDAEYDVFQAAKLSYVQEDSEIKQENIGSQQLKEKDEVRKSQNIINKGSEKESEED